MYSKQQLEEIEQQIKKENKYYKRNPHTCDHSYFFLGWGSSLSYDRCGIFKCTLCNLKIERSVEITSKLTKTKETFWSKLFTPDVNPY